MSVKILGKRSGIQYKGVEDRSELDPRPMMLNTLIIGQFRRGRLDKPMLVTSANIRKQLGYDPKNSDYVAVEDALNNGAPYVWVMRKLKGAGTGECVPSTLVLERSKLTIANSPDTNSITLLGVVEIIDQGVKTERDFSLTVILSELLEDSLLYTALYLFMQEMQFNDVPDAYLFKLSQGQATDTPETQKHLFSGTDGIFQKRSVTLTFKPTTQPLVDFAYDFLSFALNSNVPLTVHTCGYGENYPVFS